jgi:hypothetical protein
MIVDNLHKVKEILGEMFKMGGQSGTSFSGFSFLENWILNKTSKEDKDRYFSAFSCHELHLFLRKHDPDYFTEVVKPFITTKMLKTFVDYYLIDDLETIEQYASFD